MNHSYLSMAQALRQKLHAIPEKSMEEYKTKSTLIHFLQKHTSLDIVDQGSWFYARYLVDPQDPAICFRADYDAVTDADGVSRHLCGHDGHASNLAVFGKWITDHKPTKNIILLFQPGEESGEGGKICCDIFQKENIREIYGFHNIPGYPMGTVLLRKGTFACASTGLCLQFTGKTTHAAHPENGINPAKAVSELILAIDRYINHPQEHKGMILSTVIGIDLGSSSYGVSASEGTLRLTVRAEYYQEFQKLLTYIEDQIQLLQSQYGLTITWEQIETFPSTENDETAIRKLEQVALQKQLPVMELSDPFRWSEDFGWYLQQKPGALLGIGAGEDCPPLHTANYEYRDAITETALILFSSIIE